MASYAVQPEWRFDANVSDPNGVRVTVTITVPHDALPHFPGDVGDHAQTAANTAAIAVGCYIASEQEVPF